MGIRDELKQTFGDDVLLPRRWGRPSNWQEVCVCGHLGKYHGPSIGGSYLDVDDVRPMGGRQVTYRRTLDGCSGALTVRTFERETEVTDHAAGTMTVTVNPTCECMRFELVARVDRPGRMFDQRIPRDRTTAVRHPFATGVRALTTFLSRRKYADPEKGGDPAWVDAEFDRRFTWLTRRCAHLTCHETAEVWPVYVDGDPARSELRCPKHR